VFGSSEIAVLMKASAGYICPPVPPPLTTILIDVHLMLILCEIYLTPFQPISGKCIKNVNSFL
jgi:hypothetical protein